MGPDGRVAGLDINPGMLAVARAHTDSPSSIEWREGSAEALPFSDGSFDVVLCQMSLQFFPDRAAALGQMYRVLAREGRLVLNLPGPIAPLFGVLSNALGTYVTPQASGFIEQVFVMDDPDELRSLLEGAGFTEVEVRAEVPTLALPRAPDFLWQYVSSTPLASLVQSAGDESLGSLEREVVAEWAQFAAGDGMLYRQPILIGRATKGDH